MFISCICLLIVAVSFVSVNSQENDARMESLDEDHPYCFRFTWVGPEYNKSNFVNTTCAEYLDDSRAIGVPCRQPLVVTNDGSPPDLNYLFEYHRDSVVCRRSPSQVCAKYTYSFNKAVENVTYMCTKLSIVGEETGNYGCYTQMVDGHEVELCFCRWGTGDVKPCNGGATTTFISITLFIIFIFVTIMNILKGKL